MPTVFASDFANLKDLEVFKAAKARGLSDQAAFRLGDNGIGCWGDFTTTEEVAMCALPYEDWYGRFGAGSAARGKKVKVTVLNDDKTPTDRTAILELRDTMPHRDNIKNGCGIDLNPGAMKALGLSGEIKQLVSWEWASDSAETPAPAPTETTGETVQLPSDVV